MEKVERYRTPTENQIKAYNKEGDDKMKDYVKDKQMFDAK